MKKTTAIGIDGAVVFSEIRQVGDVCIGPDMNGEYRACMVQDGILFATKDFREWVSAMVVQVNGETLEAAEVADLIREIEEGRQDGAADL